MLDQKYTYLFGKLFLYSFHFHCMYVGTQLPTGNCTHTYFLRQSVFIFIAIRIDLWMDRLSPYSFLTNISKKFTSFFFLHFYLHFSPLMSCKSESVIAAQINSAQLIWYFLIPLLIRLHYRLLTPLIIPPTTSFEITTIKWFIETTELHPRIVVSKCRLID